MKTIPMTTAEWQRQKLGPSLKREAKWIAVERHWFLTLAAEVVRRIVLKLREAFDAIKPVVDRAAAIIKALDL